VTANAFRARFHRIVHRAWLVPVGYAGGDLLNQPVIAVPIAERDERAEALAARRRAGDAPGAIQVEYLADSAPRPASSARAASMS
jgi:hypothetical protein